MQNNIAHANKIQKQATDINYNIYLSASAGTGKTKTLIDRILVILLHGVNLQNILGITYTNAAANEMLERLANKLRQWHAMDHNLLKKELTNLLGTPPDKSMIITATQLYITYVDNYDYLKIQTVHSICLEILNKYHDLNGLKNNKISLIDDSQKKQFLKRAFAELFTDAEKNSILTQAINALAQKYNFQSLVNLLQNILNQKQKLHSFIQSADNLNALIKKQYKFFDTTINDELKDIWQSFLQENIEDCANFSELHDLTGHAEFKTFVNWQHADTTTRKSLCDLYVNFFVTKNLSPRKKIPLKKELLSKFPQFGAIYFAEQKRIIKFLERKNNQEQAEFMQNVIIVLNHLAKKFEQHKDAANLYDFDDLIIRTLELFATNTDIYSLLISLDIDIRHLLIDEAQDLSNMQWLVIQKIISAMENKQSSIFIIGDYKQSIYSFQGAEPDYFLNIQALCQKLQPMKKKWLTLELNHSFRSQEIILKIVDKFFIYNNYFQNIKHFPVKTGSGIFQLLALHKEEKPKEKNLKWHFHQNTTEKPNHNKQVAKKIANFIMQLLDERPDLKPRDIMVLFKKRGEKMTSLIEQLTNYQILISQINRVDFQKNIVVLDLLSLLKFVANPLDDLNFASLLKSPFFKLTTKQIHDLIFERENKKIWQFLVDSKHKITIFLQEAISIWQQESLYNFYTYFLFKKNKLKDFYAYFGRDCEKIINLFLQKILDFESTLNQGSHSFLQWLEDNATASNETFHPDGMQVITTHAAKGLQAKIVVIADADDSENTPNETIFWQDEQLVIPFNNKVNCGAIEAVKTNRKQALHDESFRLLYVAMTRAENELYVFGTEDAKTNSWFNKLKTIFPEYLLLYSDCKKKKHINNNPENQDMVAEYFFQKYTNNKTSPKKMQASGTHQNMCDYAVMRGEFVHKLLADLSLLSEDSMHQHSRNLAKSFSIKTEELAEITKIAIAILKKFPNLFHQQNIFEHKLHQRFEQKLYTIQIDLLSFSNTNIKIIEIKTDKNKRLTKDRIPESYVKQLSIYKKCIKSVYPDHQIDCFILSFYQKKLFPIYPPHV